MSKTVMIPSTQGNPWVCSVNNQKYSYEAGTEQTVPDEVAAIIDSADNFPPAAPDVDAPFNGGGSDPVLDNAKSTGGIGWTESGEQVLFDGDLLINLVTESGAFASPIAIDSLEVGQTYNIKWDGIDYTCECMDGGYGLVYFGNASILGVPTVTDEPFVFVVEDGAVLVVTASAGTYSIKVSKNGDTIHKIAEKYLPASLMVVNFEYDDEFIADKTVEEVKTAMSSGIPVFAVYHNIIGDGNDLCGFMTTFKTGTSNIDPYSPILMATLYGEDFSQTGYYEMPAVWVYDGEWMFED